MARRTKSSPEPIRSTSPFRLTSAKQRAIAARLRERAKEVPQDAANLLRLADQFEAMAKMQEQAPYLQKPGEASPAPLYKDGRMSPSQA